jgi:hypothetical protein
MKNQINKIKMFATANDTEKWVLCVDGYFGTFETKDECIAARKLIGDCDKHFDDTPFGSVAILTPMSAPYFVDPNWRPELDLISEHQAIDIVGYIIKQQRRDYWKPDTRTAKERLADKRNAESFWDFLA